MSTLYVVATPIGNLEDITFRAIRILQEADLVLCEDTRVTAKLLGHYYIDTPTESYHQHTDQKKVKEILLLLEDGKDLALVTDAGTPGISDPGVQLVEAVLSRDISVVPIPGPSALGAAISIAGVKVDEFVFLGFLPHKKGREKLFKEIASSKGTTVFYESKHRIVKALGQLGDVLGSSRRVVVCRELTKMHETVYRGGIQGVLEQVKGGSVKGEYVVIVEGK